MVQSLYSPSLVGSVIERGATTSSDRNGVPSLKSLTPNPTGFPLAQHRSKSAFARSREARRKDSGTNARESDRVNDVPIVQKSGSLLSSASGPIEGKEVLRTPENDGQNSALDDKTSSSKKTSEEQWKLQMQKSNERMVESMTEAERAQHAEEIMEQLGPNIKELLQRVREARAKPQDAKNSNGDSEETPKKTQDTSVSTEDDKDLVIGSPATSENHEDSPPVELSQPTPNQLFNLKGRISPPRGILTSPISRSSSPGRAAARKLRFADVTPNDVHVYQSERSSPRRPFALLPPPSDFDNNDVISLNLRTNRSNMVSSGETSEPKPEEGTPEDIRRRFFPHLPPNDPSLEWIEGKTNGDTPTDDEPRFDLAGTIIPKSQRLRLPTHLGLHHHAEPSTAGYTIADLLLLGRSSVPAQRATMLAVLAKIVRRVVLQEKSVSELRNPNELRCKALVLGLSSLAEKGSLGVQAIDLIWACIVFWDEALIANVEGVELKPSALNPEKEAVLEDFLHTADPISEMPFSSFLPNIATLLEVSILPSESLSQILAIVQRLARHSVQIATSIVNTPQLISNIIRVFLLTPIPPLEEDPRPNPYALTFLRTIALSSRENAQTLVGPSDALLRFVTTGIPLASSPFPNLEAKSLLCGTLELYATLAQYGLYSAIATTAMEPFGRLAAYISGDKAQTPDTNKEIDEQVISSWLRLVSYWLVCARDPHRTTPAHDLLWSQVVGWAWKDDLFLLRKRLINSGNEIYATPRLWGHLWGALAAWVEGCRVNSPKAGENERNELNLLIGESWAAGNEQKILRPILHELQDGLNLVLGTSDNLGLKVSRLADIGLAIGQYVRLCIACCSPRDEMPGIPSWVSDSFDLISDFCKHLIVHPLMDQFRYDRIQTEDTLCCKLRIVCLRAVSFFLGSYSRLWRVLSPDKNDWIIYSLILLERLLPGDEDQALWFINELLESRHSDIQCGDKLVYLKPFFKNMVCPDETKYFAPLIPTSHSIQHCTTQLIQVGYPESSQSFCYGLPLDRHWPCIALDHLLRSGTSPVLTNPKAVPDSWSASETDLVQGSLSLMLFTINTFSQNKDSVFQTLSPRMEHVVFSCMEVFMLEHNQQEMSSNDEVFRDAIVGQLMEKLLRPFTYGASVQQKGNNIIPSEPGSVPTSLETVSQKFLGKGTPFFQFYTDFLSLYDAISFSHRTFARLLLPPTSMDYAHDYRKLLWGDYGHILRTIRIPFEDVIVSNHLSKGLRSYLHPVDTDPEMVGWYLRALIKWPIEGFVRFISVHHVASNIWPDLRISPRAEGDIDTILSLPPSAHNRRARVLLSAILNQASNETIKDILCYRQNISGLDGVLLPPACFLTMTDVNKIEARIEFVRGLGNDALASSFSEKVSKVYGCL